MLNTCRNETVADEALCLVQTLKSNFTYDANWLRIERVLRSPQDSGENTRVLESAPWMEMERHDTAESDHEDGFANDVPSSGVVRYDEARLRSAILFIHEHLDEAICVHDVIRHLGISRRWLEYAFRDAFGITPYQYLRRVRLERARSLLIAEPKKKVYQIASRTGFSSARQFTTSFRQFFGFSPSDCRKQLHAENSPSASFQS